MSDSLPALAELPGRYLDLQLHAHGGLGEVYRGRDAELNRPVAVKRVQPRFISEERVCGRFLREAEITARLEHPGIPPVYGLVRDGSGQPCLAMRFIQGQSLQDAINAHHNSTDPDPARRGLAFRQLLQRFVALCNIVAYAHSQGILHRDLKPANVMLGDYGETLVVDWGLARTLPEVLEESALAEVDTRIELTTGPES